MTMNGVQVQEGITRFVGAYAFLSNFHPSVVYIGDNIAYPTAEHAFQAYKTADMSQRIRIAHLSTPGEAKGAGRRVDLRPDWEQIKKQAMLRVVMAKFTHDPERAAALCATDRAPLMEGNTWHDNYWGDCRCGQQACDPRGLNYLGQILMAARMVLRAN